MSLLGRKCNKLNAPETWASTPSPDCAYCFYLIETFSFLPCFSLPSCEFPHLCSCPFLSASFLFIRLPSSPTHLSAHLLFHRSEFPDSGSHSRRSRCRRPRRYERPQSELPHQSQVKTKASHSSYRGKFWFAQILTRLQSYRSASPFPLAGPSRKPWSAPRSAKRLTITKRYMFVWAFLDSMLLWLHRRHLLIRSMHRWKSSGWKCLIYIFFCCFSVNVFTSVALDGDETSSSSSIPLSRLIPLSFPVLLIVLSGGHGWFRFSRFPIESNKGGKIKKNTRWRYCARPQSHALRLIAAFREISQNENCAFCFPFVPFTFYLRIENAEGYVLIAVHLFICMRVIRITKKVLNLIAWNLVGWLVIIRGPFD